MENKKQDKIDKILQKVEQKSSKIYNEDNDPVIAAANLLQTEEYMKGLKDPSFSSVFNTQMKLQDLEAKKDLYKAAKLQEEFSTEPYDDRYVDLATGEIKRISENKNYNMKLQSYDLGSNFKSFLSGFAGDAIQGVGLGLDTVYNGLIGGLASVGEIGQYIFNGEEKNAQTRKQLEKDLADNFDRISLFTDMANTLARPFNEYERDKNFVNIHQDLDHLGESFDKGNIKEFTKELVNTGLHTAPTMVEGLLSYGAAVPALAKLNKENQAKELGVNPNEILDTTNRASLAELAGATVYGLGGKLELASMKGAIGRGLVGQSGKASSGFIDKMATPTRSVFDKLKPNTLGEDIPGLNAALKAGYYGTLGTGKAIKNLAKYGSGVGLVALGEGLSEGVQTAGEKIATGDFQNKSFEENYKDLEESMLLGAIAGGGLGAVGKAVTAPIGYVSNKSKEIKVFETAKQNAAELSKTLNVKDMFSSSIKETTDSKGNVHQTREVENPLANLPKEEVKLRDNIFYNLSQTSLSKYESDPNNTAEDSVLNVNKNIPLLNEVFSLGASGFLSHIQKDGIEIPSQEIIYESIKRAEQAVNEHIDSIIKTDPNTDTDGVISTLAEFKKKIENNSALDYYVARQILTNPDKVKQLLARTAGKTSDTPTQNEGEGQTLGSYENMTNAAIKQGQEAAVKGYTQEQLKNLKKASKFISEITGIEELAEEFDKTNTNNSKGSAVVTVQDLLSKINKTIDILSEPIDKNDEFQKSRNNILNTSLSTMLTGTKASTGEVKEGLAPMLKRIAQRQKEGGEFDSNGKTIGEDRSSLKWWLNSHRAKYGLLTYILKDLKENGAGEAIYTVPKNIDTSGEVNKVFDEVKVYRGRGEIIEYLKTLAAVAKNNAPEEADSESIPGSIAKRANKLIEALNNKGKNKINGQSLMGQVREFISIESGEHVFSTSPRKSKEGLEELKNTFRNIRNEVEKEGGAIKAALDLIDPSSSKTDSTTNKDNTTNNEEIIAKKDTQTTAKPKQETTQESNQEAKQEQPKPKQGVSKSAVEPTPNYSDTYTANFGKEDDHLTISPEGGSYNNRTYWNIRYSDITIAFSKDFNTSGEKATTDMANKQGKYLRPGTSNSINHEGSNLHALDNPKEIAKEIANFFKEKYPNKKNFILNIAGNGIYRLHGEITQQQLNSKMREALKELINELPGIKIQVRSGGQTGMDLAGAVAAYSLGLDTTMYMPYGYKIRPSDKKDKSFYSRQDFIDYIRSHNMHKLEDSSTTQSSSSGGFKRNNSINTTTRNAQTPQPENSNEAQKVLEEKSNDNSSKDIDVDTTITTANTTADINTDTATDNHDDISINTTDIENFKEAFESGAGTEIDEKVLEEINKNANINNIENVEAIKAHTNKMLGSAIEARDGKVKITNKDTEKEVERKAETQSRFLNLEKILKVKENPKSLLSVPNTKLSSTINKINNALKTSFGLKDTLDVSGFISFFNMLDRSKYLDSGKKEYKDINNTITLFSNENVRLSAIVRALGALTDSRFSYSDFKDVKEKYPNLKNRREIPSEPLKYLLRGVSLSDIASDVGKRILSDVGLEINEETATLADTDRIYQELGIVAIMSLEYLGLVNVTGVKYATFYNNTNNENASEKRVILNLENVYTKEGSGNLSTAISFITNLEEDLKLDKSEHESTYSTKPFNVSKFVKTKQGVFALTKKMYKAINAFLNTPFVVENHKDVKEFIEGNEKKLKEFLGYIDLSEYIDKDRNLINGKTPTILYGETRIKYSDIDSVLGKNLQVENSINDLKDLLNDGSAATDGIYFNKTFSSGRLWLQSATVNPQSNKLHRFLVTLKTQTKTERLNKGNLSNSTYIAIAQAFGYKTDKETGAINVGKAIVDTEGLRDKVAEALSNGGEITLGNGTKLEIEEIGHALNALFNIEKFLKAKEENPNLTEFKHNIVEEVDGINNGIALKGLTFFVSPKTIKTLLSTGISFFGELSGNKVMPEKFSAEATKNGKANPDKAWDTYEEFAIVTSKGFKKTTEILSTPTSIELANLKAKEKVNALNEKDKEILASNKDKAEVDYAFVNMADRFGISTKEKDKEKLQQLRTNIENFGRAMSGINNLEFVEGDPDTIKKVSKESRKLNKYVVIPSSYGSGLTSNIRSLTTFVVDNFGDWVLRRDKNKEFEKSPEWGIVSSILDSLDTLSPTIKYRDYSGVEQELSDGGLETLKNFVLNNADGIGAAKVTVNGNTITLYDFINSHMEVVTRQGVKESRDTILPGYESVNNTINSIHNLFQVVLTNKYNSIAMETLINSGRLEGINLEGNTIPTHLLTIKEHKEILKTLRKDFPSITVDSKERFGENKEARHVGRISMANMDKVRTSTNEIGIYYPGIYLHSSTRGAKGEYASKPFSMGLSSKSIIFSSVGATPTAIMTQQKDATDMIEAMGNSADDNGGQVDINDIFDAILRHSSDGSSNKSLISMYNRSQVNEALSSSQLYEQVALAAKAARDMSEIDEDTFNTVLSDKISNGINKTIKDYKKSNESDEKVSPKDILVMYAKGLAAVMHMKYTISEVNKAVVKNLTTVASNMQNGHESDKAKINPEKGEDLLELVENSIINDPYSEQDPKEYILKNLMLDITEPDIAEKLSSIEDMLNSIYDNRIPNNTKDLPNGTIEKFKTEIKELQELINSKILDIRKNLWKVKAKETAKYLTVHIKPLGEGAFSLEPNRDKGTGRDKSLDEDEGRVASDTEAVEEVKEETTEEEKVEENNSLSSNSPTKNNEIKEDKETDTKSTKEPESNIESQGNTDVIERLANALEESLKPKSQKDKGVEGINPDVAKENTSARVEKVKNKLNEILKVGFGRDINLNTLKGDTRKGFNALKNLFKDKLENFNVDEYLKDPTKYLENLFKDIVGKDSIFDKINKEVLKSFENVDDTKVGDTSMDEFVSQIDLTTDKVSTTQEQMRNIDEANGRAMSKEFSNHLKGVLSELASLASEAVNGVKVKYFKSKGKGHNEGEYLTKLREILIKEGIPLSKGNFTGTAGLEEIYGHELLHAITYYVIKAQAGGNPLTRELSMLHKRYLSVMTPSKLAKHINSGIPSKDLEVANRIMGHFENNTIEGLSEFIAIALSNEAVWNSLKDIEVKSDPNYDNMTFGERVVAKAMKMFNTFFNSIYRKYQDNDTMQKAMLVMATKIAAANSKAEYKLDKEMDYNTLETADTLTTVANSLSSGLDKVDEVTSEKLNKLKDYVKSKGVKLVSVPKSKRRKYNSRWEEIRGLVSILASDVVGDKTVEATLSVAHDVGLHYNGIIQYVVSEISQMSDVKRIAEYLSRQRKLLDSDRVVNIKRHAEVLEEYFNTPLTLAENQVLGEGMLDTDLSSLLDHYSIDELPDILNNTQSYKEKAYSDMLKEVDNNFKDRVGKYSKDDYKRYITNQANSLAYFMNFQTYRNEVEGAIGVKNPTMIAMAVGTGANLKPNKKVVSAIDKYVTLAALEYLESDVKDLIVEKLRTEPKGMEAMMNYHRTFKAESLDRNFGGNPALMMKGYRYDVIEDYIDIKIAPVSEESLLKSQGFRRVSKEPLRKSPDDNSEERAIYINDFISSTAGFNQQAVSYLGHTGRGSKLSDIYNDKIFRGADVHTVEQEWYDSIVDLTKNSSIAARKLMSPNYSPANFKDKKDSENIMVPIFDENGNLRDFAYLMSKKTKKDLLGLDTSLTKSLSNMSARAVHKYESQKLNERVADELYKDYAEANSAERQYHFVEMSFESKDPYIREIYKMLEPSFKNYLEEKFDGKIMVRASTMLNFFGQRDMDYRNTANYREKDVPYKKVLLASIDVARQLAKLVKMEIVLRFGSTIYNNFVSNGMTLAMRGVPVTSIVKDQIEGGRLLNKYLKDSNELKKLEAKKRAGGDVRDVEIGNLKRELERSPIKDMMDFGLFSTIQTFEDINLEDKDNSWTARQVRKYTVENENIPEDVREWIQKGYDWAFVTDRTVIGKNLTMLVQMGDFVARYALYKHYMRDSKMSKKEALEKVSDEFINYDLPVNKVVKFANDHGFLFFTRYYIVSQKVMAMLASDKPVSASLVVGLQALFNIDFADIFDGNVFTKDLGSLVSNPFINLFNVLSPTGYDLVKGAYSRI
ncbi:hypothetical protein [Campylobacter sp. RM12176]|uniref:hypothetical protein n=1 Tax=Campylobacter sp. RM12176 TaxID=2735788 RepID=UPI00301C11C2|nr:hypothetical protein [Campylobacter sp. RM12176]